VSCYKKDKVNVCCTGNIFVIFSVIRQAGVEKSRVGNSRQRIDRVLAVGIKCNDAIALESSRLIMAFCNKAALC